MEFIQELVNMSNKIMVENNIKDNGKSIYHYTSPLGLQSIIKCQTMRFTDRDYLNDASEGIYVLNLCIKRAKEIMKNAPEFLAEFENYCKARLNNPPKSNFHIFQCSFSTEKDSLCLWNYYTKGDSIKGYNLKFSPKQLKEAFVFDSNFSTGNVPHVYSGQVIYDENEQLKILKNVVDKFYEFSTEKKHINMKEVIEFLLDKILFIGTFFKNTCFKVEKEFRLVIGLHLDKYGNYFAIKEEQKFMERDGIFIPFTDIEFKPEALIGITISPTLDGESALKSLKRITAGKFENLKKESNFSNSQIPVRY